MALQTRIIALSSAVVVGFGAGWATQGWRLGLALEKERAGHAEAISAIAREAAELQERNLRAVARVEGLRRDLADSVAEAAALRERKAEVVERYIDREVIRYVQTDNARDCGLSADGVRLHDTAARGRDGMPPSSDTATEPDDSAIAARNAEVVSIVTRNYQTCRADQRRLEALQEWVRQQE